MAQVSDYRLGADVIASEGNKVGTLASVLVADDGFEPKAIVVKNETTFAGRLRAEERLFVSDEVVIPISAVESVTRESVQLAMSGDDVRKQPPYISYRLNAPNWRAAVGGQAEIIGGGLGMPSAEQVANKPADQLEIDSDEKVMLGTTGRTLGRIHDLLYDRGKLVGVVIRPEGFFKRDVVLPMRFISRADDLALFADITESDIEQLKPFDAEP